MNATFTKRVSFLLILLLFLVFSNGQFSIFFAVWIFTTMLLYTVRKLPRYRGFLLAWFSLGLVYFIGFNITPLPIIIHILISLLSGLVGSLPYLIDSIFKKKRNFFLTTLIFPTSAVIIEYIYLRFNIYGTWGHFAYTQQSQYVLLQSVSVLGMGYITFLITWFASVCNWVYEQRNEGKNIKKGILIYGLVLGLTLIYGGYRVLFQKPVSETIRVASISAIDSLKVNYTNDLIRIKKQGAKNDAKILFRENVSKLNQNLFDRSVKEAQAGAKIVFWAEGNGLILKEDEKTLYNEASQIASKENIYLGLGVGVIDPSNSKPLENKFVLFDQAGKKVIDYWKNIAVPGGEAEISNLKDTGILKTETPYGTIAGVICFDLDFPHYIKEAKGSDILLAPSNDWKEIDPIHTHMAKFRAIEQGFNMVRQTSFGLSIGADYTGRVLSQMDHFTDNGKVLITQLPTKGVKTIYSIIGDTFIIFCLLLLVMIIVFLKRQKTGNIK